MPDLHCPVCGGDRLTSQTQLHVEYGQIALWFDTHRNGLVDRTSRFPAKLARACLNCGHVMVFLDEEVRSVLGGELPHLGPRGSGRW
jgi:hypothetical protein